MLQLLALATLTFTPVVTFTTDSVYTQENIITVEVVDTLEDEMFESKDLIIKEKELLGYMVYDNPNTPYVDGLKFDDLYVYDWVVHNFDDTVQHTITVKTVYTNDVAGTLAAAKDGNWGAVLSNPLVLLQMFYYILAAASVILGGFGLLKARKYKVKTVEELTVAFENKFTEIVSTILTESNKENLENYQNIIKALVLSQGKDKDSKLALLDVLSESANKDVTELSKTISKQIIAKHAVKEKLLSEAKKAVRKISSGNHTDTDNNDNDLGGLAI